jgi:mannose-1-phosphate guanylyltransferase
MVQTQQTQPTVKAVILVGGPSVGTKFRPLSMDCIKPLFPIAGHATIHHHVQALAKVPGIIEILLIGFYDAHVFDRFLIETQIEFPQTNVRYLREYQSMGTAGGLFHFRDELKRGNPNNFFVLNSDIASSFPLEHLLRAHRKSDRVATIMAINVPIENASRYGCIVHDTTTMEVKHFVEKPESFISNLASCGVYVFDFRIMALIEKATEEKQQLVSEMGIDLTGIDPSLFTRSMNLANQNYALSNGGQRPPVNLEADVLKHMILKSQLYAFICDENQFWMSVKTGSSTIQANRLYLQVIHFINS